MTVQLLQYHRYDLNLKFLKQNFINYVDSGYYLKFQIIKKIKKLTHLIGFFIVYNYKLNIQNIIGLLQQQLLIELNLSNLFTKYPKITNILIKNPLRSIPFLETILIEIIFNHYKIISKDLKIIISNSFCYPLMIKFNLTKINSLTMLHGHLLSVERKFYLIKPHKEEIANKFTYIPVETEIKSYSFNHNDNNMFQRIILKTSTQNFFTFPGSTITIYNFNHIKTNIGFFSPLLIIGILNVIKGNNSIANIVSRTIFHAIINSLNIDNSRLFADNIVQNLINYNNYFTNSFHYTYHMLINSFAPIISISISKKKTLLIHIVYDHFTFDNNENKFLSGTSNSLITIIFDYSDIRKYQIKKYLRNISEEFFVLKDCFFISQLLSNKNYSDDKIKFFRNHLLFAENYNLKTIIEYEKLFNHKKYNLEPSSVGSRIHWVNYSTMNNIYNTILTMKQLKNNASIVTEIDNIFYSSYSQFENVNIIQKFSLEKLNNNTIKFLFLKKYILESKHFPTSRFLKTEVYSIVYYLRYLRIKLTYNKVNTVIVRYN
uniref:Uncharacterized protein n=1 Tax=Amorphochlora amoebiformis TaxID=1561963 RepID=A0A7S0DK50_9EUKA|mmetsp:Transcript_28186/g.44864  ORF Transcript_28186/g.44864 Transcript_28186/m.44864 type:complete len:545 (+) Transcript_28186:505-2139(+)